MNETATSSHALPGPPLVERIRQALFGREGRILLGFAALFAVIALLPIGTARFDTAALESLHLARWYAREHIVLCLLPAFLIAGAISVFVSQAAVIRYLGPGAKKSVAYGVAAVSGTLLAVCSCTVLPLFAGIHRRGAGLGPAIAFLYSGPAINALAIILTARILGFELGLARAVFAIVFSVVVGLLMHLIFRREETARQDAPATIEAEDSGRPLWHTAAFFAALTGVLVFANWGAPATDAGFFAAIYALKWWLTAASALALAVVLLALHRERPLPLIVTALVAAAAHWLLGTPPVVTFGIGFATFVLMLRFGGSEESQEWLGESWTFAKQILPLLLAGVLVAGLLLGRPDTEGLIPASWVETALGGEGLAPTLLAAVAGALMYFATLTEVPILEGLLGAGMGQGPALALLLAGPALSLPNLLVIRSVLGTRKTIVYLVLVVGMATLSGLLYGHIV